MPWRVLVLAFVCLLSVSCGSPVAAEPDALTPAGLPNVPLLKGGVSGHIDRINDVVTGTDRIPVAAGEPVTLFGWALDGEAKELAAEVYIEVGGQGYRAQYFQPRPDVGKQYGKEALNYAGFNVTIAGGKLPVGEQTVWLHLVSHDRKGQYVGSPVPIIVR